MAALRGMIMGSQSCNPAADANSDGCITLLDLAQIRAIITGGQSASYRYVDTFDFSSGAGTAHLARYKQVGSMPTDIFPSEAGWQAFTAGDYTDIEAIDTSSFNMSANASAYNALQCRFTAVGDFNTSFITDLGINFTGTSDTLEVWAWNFDTSSWKRASDSIISSGSEETGVVHTVCDCWGKVYASYINGSDHMYLLFIHDAMNEDLSADYFRIELTYP